MSETKPLFIPKYLAIEGGHQLQGTVEISGAKNEVLGAMAAAVLTDRPVRLDNVPHISDVIDMGHIMMELGVDVGYDPDARAMRLHAEKITENRLSEKAAKFRASYYLWGSLLARFSVTGEFDSLRVRMPGGCNFKGRATDYHFNLLQNIFGASIGKAGGETVFTLPPARADAARDNRPVYSTDQVSHGATFHWLLSAALSDRQKYIYNASLEPEVPHLLGMLNKMGARLRGDGTTAISSFGRKSGGLMNGGAFNIMPDRMEAGSYALMALATRGNITLDGVDLKSCRPWTNSVIEILGNNRGKNFTQFTGDAEGEALCLDFRGQELDGRSFIMSPIPGKETDLQQIWTAVLATARDSSTIIDPIWPNRNMHIEEMRKFGLDCQAEQIDIDNINTPKALKISVSPSQIRPAVAAGMDLRGTFGLLVLAAAADGKSIIESPGWALRGYPNLVKNLQGLHVHVTQSEEGTALPLLPAFGAHSR